MIDLFLRLDPVWQALTAAAALMLLIQLIYILVVYWRIPGYRQSVKNPEQFPVSIVVVVRDQLYWIEEALPKLLAQNYPTFEVVVVDDASETDLGSAVQMMMLACPNLRYTRLNPSSKLTRTRKLALTVVIKACAYPNILFTEPNCYPTSDQWLSIMAKGFSAGDVVIGYCGMEETPGFRNRLIRCDRLMTSVRYLSAAIAGRPYRGIAQNLAYTSAIYFGNKGFNRLDLNTGDDDLFIRKIARRDNTAIILNPKATLRQYPYRTFRAWFGERKYLSYTFRYYPTGVKNGQFVEFFSRLLFWGATIALLAGTLRIHPLWIAAGGAILLRWLVLLFTVSRVARRLGERGLLGALLFHDLFSPVWEVLLALARRIRPSKGIWE
ncbi:MAG: glycosyltransferase [Rikenellaceae bacterium]|nr:glycosyltransferase [Rikenellaceae bacterium]